MVFEDAPSNGWRMLQGHLISLSREAGSSRPNVVTLGIRIGAFEKGRQWQHALWTLFHGPHKCLVFFSLLFQGQYESTSNRHGIMMIPTIPIKLERIQALLSTPTQRDFVAGTA